jgi:rhodanese-related sulfurtransferase
MQSSAAKLDDAILKRLVPLGALPGEARRELLDKARIESLPKGAYVFRTGDTDDDAVYLLDGEIQLFSEDRLTGAVRGGTAAASHPLSPKRPRENSGRARNQVTVLRIHRPLLDKKLTWFQEAADGTRPAREAQANEWKVRLSRSNLFSRVPAANIQKIFSSMQPVAMKKGDTVIRQGSQGDYYFVIEQGRCVVTRRPAEQEQALKLADLNVGDGFGEQALLSDGRHSVTVTMLTDGVLRRLDKSAFAALVKSPALRTVTQADAQSLVRAGAVWLDVRLAEEHRESGISGSLNAPLAALRQGMGKLAKSTPYIVYCDTGERSSAAAFALSQAGFDAYLLDGGLMGLQEPGGQPASASTGGSAKVMPSLSADIALSELKVALARVNQQVEEAVRQRVKREALLRAQQEAAERLQRQGKAAEQRAAQEIAKRLESTRLKAERDAERVEEILKAARQAQHQLEAARERAEEEAGKQRSAVETLQTELREKLSAGKRRLEAEYAEATQRIETLGRMKKEADSELSEEREHLEASVGMTGERLSALERELIQARQAHEAAKASLRELDRQRDRRLAELEREEESLRAAAEGQLRAGRERLEAELAGNMQLLDQARREQEKAEAAKRQAEEESARIARETKAAEERIRKEAAAQLQAERKRLAQEATQIKQQLDVAKRMQEKAEAARRTAQEKVRKLQSVEAGVTSRATETAKKLEQELARREAEVRRAKEETEAARRARMDVEVNKDIVENAETERRAAEDNLRAQLAADVQDWARQDHVRETTIRTTSSRIQEALKRINEQLEQERREDAEATENMLEEIQSQLKNAR